MKNIFIRLSLLFCSIVIATVIFNVSVTDEIYRKQGNDIAMFILCSLIGFIVGLLIYDDRKNSDKYAKWLSEYLDKRDNRSKKMEDNSIDD